METKKIKFTPYNNREKIFEGEFVETNEFKVGDWFLTHHVCINQEVQIAQEVKAVEQCMVFNGEPVYDLITMSGSSYKSNLKLVNADFTNVLYREPTPLVYGKEETYFNVQHKISPPKYLAEWLSCYDVLIKMGFSLAEIEYALFTVGMTLKDLTEIKGFDNVPTYHKTKSLAEENHWYYKTHYKSWGGRQYESRERVNGFGVRIRDQYQGLKHGKIIYALLSNRYAWFKDFKWSIYELHGYKNGIDEIYMKVTPKADNDHQTGSSLYVPYDALIKSDWNIIVQRVEGYFKDYYKGADRKKYLDAALGMLETEEALKLKEILNSNKKDNE